MKRHTSVLLSATTMPGFAAGAPKPGTLLPPGQEASYEWYVGQIQSADGLNA
jgi:hypothetical protein